MNVKITYGVTMVFFVFSIPMVLAEQILSFYNKTPYFPTRDFPINPGEVASPSRARRARRAIRPRRLCIRVPPDQWPIKVRPQNT